MIEALLPEAGGDKLLPFGGISLVQTVYCNESGTWAIYDADEHGFRNRRGRQVAGQVDVAVIGDSFVAGACVGPEGRTWRC